MIDNKKEDTLDPRLAPMTSLKTMSEIISYIDKKTGIFGPYFGIRDGWLWATTGSAEGRDEFNYQVIRYSWWESLDQEIKAAMNAELRIRFCIYGLRKIQERSEADTAI